MKSVKHLIMMLVLAMFNALFARQEMGVPAAKGDLYVVLTGYKTDKGKIRIALHNSEQDYQSDSSAFRGDSIRIEQNRSVVIYENIPYGDYAIKVYHDQNNDGKLNTNFFGMPTEVYGFSNNARGTFGPASWSAAKFKHAIAVDSIRIFLK